MKKSNIYKRVEELEKRITNAEKLDERRYRIIIASLDQISLSLLSLIESEKTP